jgi:hypothetical protein
MSYAICIHCPDTHIQNDGRTPDTIGVGGGITARIRLATHLAELVRSGYIPWKWKNIAKTWEMHWNWLLHEPDQADTTLFPCKACSKPLLSMADGYHCSICGLYFLIPGNDLY